MGNAANHLQNNETMLTFKGTEQNKAQEEYISIGIIPTIIIACCPFKETEWK